MPKSDRPPLRPSIRGQFVCKYRCLAGSASGKTLVTATALDPPNVSNCNWWATTDDDEHYVYAIAL